MHTTTTEYNSVITMMIVVVLVMEFGTVLLTTYKRSLFGFFVTTAVFSGTIGGVLAYNAARDWAAQFTPYQTIKGVQTWRSTKTLFWSNIDGTFILVFIAIAIVCALLASLRFALHARDNVKKGRTEKQNVAKRPSARSAVPPESTSSLRAATTEDETASKRPTRRRTETNPPA